MGIGSVSTFLFYWLVRTSDQIWSGSLDGAEATFRRIESVGQNLGLCGKRRIASRERDLNLISSSSENNLSESSNDVRTKPAKQSDKKTKMTIARWFKQPQLYQVLRYLLLYLSIQISRARFNENFHEFKNGGGYTLSN